MSFPMNAQRPDGQRVARRTFVKLGGAIAAGVATTNLFDARFAHAAGSPTTSAETYVGELYASLSDKQKTAVWRPFDHADRLKINPNWHVSKTTIGDDLFSQKQKTLVDQIVRNITSKDGYERLIEQMEYDDGGLESYSFALFGEPGSDQFQFELTGRHVTMRADGNQLDKIAFGGPVVYGHGEEYLPDSPFFQQTLQANKVFQALDADQAKLALQKKAPSETAVQLKGESGQFPGVGVDQLSSDQKELVESTLKMLLAPYRENDSKEVMEILNSSGGIDQLHMAFYQQEDVDNDRVWDIWRVEGPSMVWHFRGAPHVHAYLNIGTKS
ncbi:MAG TPA: DUF3500 domain-containing protein [Rhodopirellula baltica]|uniref:DUF3500 domain-containing protein n=1 Tax=Rhodopirellula baltica (strain DSM 10527 / NCIMB 13988 / SH1) TaxID=243090 RepID=Q7UWE2_RHOBA|nr:hypothetical protein RB2096 [Rhodopirellula baltica SH 1]HBE63571.1 DUF3500 domain-containing protein [Rhodopirellula baltica]